MQRIPVICFFFLSFVLKLWMAAFIPVNADAGIYLNDAILFGEGKRPYLNNFISRDPVYLFLLSLSLRIFGNSLLSGRILSVIMSTLSGIFLYKIVKMISDKKQALVSLFIYSFYPFFMWWGSEIKTEYTSYFFISAGIYFLLKGHLKNNKWDFFIGGMMGALAHFSRESFLAVFLAIIFWLFYQNIIDEDLNVRRCVEEIILFVTSYLIFLLLISGLIYGRNIFSKKFFTLVLPSLTKFDFIPYYLKGGIYPAGEELSMFRKILNAIWRMRFWSIDIIKYFSLYLLGIFGFICLYLKMKKTLFLVIGLYLISTIYTVIRAQFPLLIPLQLLSFSIIILYLFLSTERILNLKKEGASLLLLWMLCLFFGYSFFNYNIVYNNDFSLPISAISGIIIVSIPLNSFFKKVIGIIFYVVCFIQPITYFLITNGGDPRDINLQKAKVVAEKIKNFVPPHEEVFTADYLVLFLAQRPPFMKINNPYPYCNNGKDFYMFYQYSIPPPSIFIEMVEKKANFILLEPRCTIWCYKGLKLMEKIHNNFEEIWSYEDYSIRRRKNFNQ